jgi:hypothetical protein
MGPGRGRGDGKGLPVTRWGAARSIWTNLAGSRRRTCESSSRYPCPPGQVVSPGPDGALFNGLGGEKPASETVPMV